VDAECIKKTCIVFVPEQRIKKAIDTRTVKKCVNYANRINYVKDKDVDYTKKYYLCGVFMINKCVKVNIVIVIIF
jgi:hypothetical protein